MTVGCTQTSTDRDHFFLQVSLFFCIPSTWHSSACLSTLTLQEGLKTNTGHFLWPRFLVGGGIFGWSHTLIKTYSELTITTTMNNASSPNLLAIDSLGLNNEARIELNRFWGRYLCRRSEIVWHAVGNDIDYSYQSTSIFSWGFFIHFEIRMRWREILNNAYLHHVCPAYWLNWKLCPDL